MGLISAWRAYRWYARGEKLLGQAQRAWKEGNVQGMRTILVGLVGLLASILAAKGIILPQSDQGAMVGLVMSVMLIVQRIKTTEKASWSSSTVWYGLAAGGFAVLARNGIVISEADQAAFVAGLGSVVMLGMRLMTRTPVGVGPGEPSRPAETGEAKQPDPVRR